MRLAAEDHVVHVAMTDVVFFLHCTIPFSFSLTRLLYARANEKLYEKGQQRIKKRLADFYAQEGHCICKIKKRRRLCAAHGANNLEIFCRDMCVAENTLREVSVELSA